MRFRRTTLETELAALPQAERDKRLAALWSDFQRSPTFELFAYVLRDLESQALERIRQHPTRAPEASAMVLHVVELIRQGFQALAVPGQRSDVAWGDDEAFLDEEGEARESGTE